MTEAELQDRLRKIEALFSGATSAGEREAAGAAIRRIGERMREFERADPPVEYRFSLSDPYKRMLFLALLRRYGINPYRRPRQKRQSVMAKVSRRFVEETLWPEFLQLSEVLDAYLLEITQTIIRREIHADTAEPDEEKTLPGR